MSTGSTRACRCVRLPSLLEEVRPRPLAHHLSSSQLWETIAQSRWFSKSAFVLFLNKRDRLADKILSGHSPLSSFLPSYTGPDGDVSAAEAFLAQLFKDLYRPSPARPLFTHLTCATDTTSTRVVLGVVLQSVLTRALADIGML